MFVVKLIYISLLVATGCQVGVCQIIGPTYNICHGSTTATMLCNLPDNHPNRGDFNEIEMKKQINNSPVPDVTTSDLMAEKTEGDTTITYGPDYNDPSKHLIAIDPQEKGATVVVFGVDYTDDAFYFCVFKGPTVADSYVQLRLVVQEYSPSITLVNSHPSPDDETISQDSKTSVSTSGQVTLTCRVEDSSPAATIEWFRTVNGNMETLTDGVDGFSIPTLTVIDGAEPPLTDTISNLIFTPSITNMGDLIGCKTTQGTLCTTTDGVDVRSFMLNVLSLLTDVTVELSKTQPGPAQTTTTTGVITDVDAGQQATFVCEAMDANPQATFSWSIGGTTVTDSTTGISISTTHQTSSGFTDSTSTLTFTPEIANQGDAVICKASQTPAGFPDVDQQVGFILNIYDAGSAKLTNTATSPEDSITISTIDGTSRKTTNVMADVSTTFTCEVENDSPDAEISWFNNGIDLGISGNTYEFTPSVNDQGNEIMCQAVQRDGSTVIGTRNLIFDLNVLDFPDTMRIYVRKPSETTYTEYGNDANVIITPGLVDFHCEVNKSNPVVTVSWTFDGASVSEHSSSGSSGTVTTLFDYDSYVLERNIQSCVEVVCAASNSAIVQLGQPETYTRTVNIIVAGIPSTSVVITPPAFGTGDPPVRGSVSNHEGMKVLELHEGRKYSLQCRAQGADPDEDIEWTIDDCSGGSSTLLRRAVFSGSDADCIPQDDTDTWDDYIPIHISQHDKCLRCTAGDKSDACRLNIIPFSSCEPARVRIWEYVTEGVTIPLYYDDLPEHDRIIKANANEVRTLNCTSYEAAPIPYNAWTTPDGAPLSDTFISSDCAIVYEEVESALTTQLEVKKYDTTKCLNMILDYSWHLRQIQCSATNIANTEGVDSVPVTIYVCVPCQVNLGIVATNFHGESFDTNNGSTISFNANGEPRTLTCINRGARGLDPVDDKPILDFYIKEHGSDTFEKLQSADGVELPEEKLLYIENDPIFGQDKYQGLWEVRRDITLNAESTYDIDSATLACVCRNGVYQSESEARFELKLKVIDTPLIDENLIMVQGYPNMIRDVANTEILLVNYGPFVRQRRQAIDRETLEVTCIARATRPAVDIVWRIAGNLISEDYINVVIEDSTLNVGAGQKLQDTISTLTVYPVPRSYHYQNVTCEVASSSELYLRSATLIVLTPPDTPLQLTGNNAIEEEGQMVTLECRAANGYPEGVFQWRSGNTILREEQVQSQSSLLPNYRYEQSSTYSFSATRELNGRNITCAFLQFYEEYDFVAETTASIVISLAYCPSSSAQVTSCPTSPIHSGQILDLTCESAVVNPASELVWLINNVEQIPTPPLTTREVASGYITTRNLIFDLRDSNDGVQIECCHRSAIGGTPCDSRCSDVCTVDVVVEQPPPSGQTCRWVRVGVTMENINGNSALWETAYDDSSSSEYQQLISYILNTFRTIYSQLTDYRSSVVPSIYRTPEGLIGVIIGLEFNSPYGTDIDTIHNALIDTLDSNGVIDSGTNFGYSFDIIPNSITEACVCPTNFCVRGPACFPSEDDFSSSCQCPVGYAPPRCKDHEPVPGVTTSFPPSRGISHGRLVFVLEEIDDLPTVWIPAYDDPSSEAAQELIHGLEAVLTELFGRSFSCLRRAIVADLFEQYSRGIGVIVGLEFTPDCGNSVQAIRNVFIHSIDYDGKIDGSIYEIDADMIDIGVEEVCGPFYLCANGGFCEPSMKEYRSSCRCPPSYTGPNCEGIIVTSPTKAPRPPPKEEPTQSGLSTTELILIIVFSIMGAALLLGLLLCCSCFCCCPLAVRTRRRYIYTDEEERSHKRPQKRPLVEDDWPWQSKGRPAVTYNTDSFERHFSYKY